MNAILQNKKPVIFSGIQPSGALNIGGYLGSLKNWVHLQDEYECLFSLVDLHTITVRQDPQLLRENFYNLLTLYIACGIDPTKNIIFCQSHVRQHCELAWILNCYTYIGELNRMTQFKDKSRKHESNINAGLFTYPTLMAADILLYNTNLVPVGEDQKQHVELTRDVAMRFNNLYGTVFTIPEVYHPRVGARVMSLQDPSKKMSKSDENLNGTLLLLDAPKVIEQKIKRAVTDSEASVRFDEANKPGVANLLNIFAAISGKTIAELESVYQGQGYGKFKGDLAEAMVAFLAPIQQRYQELRKDTAHLDTVLQRGAEAASERAEPMLCRVKEAVGLIATTPL
jgi:tryptophanyl-tRNA synthetase